MPPESVAVTEPSGSSVSSPVVLIVKDLEPLVGTVTLWVPALTPKAPVADTATLTLNAECGVGLAVTVKPASAPSVTSPSETMLNSGTSSSDTATVAEPALDDTV